MPKKRGRCYFVSKFLPFCGITVNVRKLKKSKDDSAETKQGGVDTFLQLNASPSLSQPLRRPLFTPCIQFQSLFPRMSGCAGEAEERRRRTKSDMSKTLIYERKKCKIPEYRKFRGGMAEKKLGFDVIFPCCLRSFHCFLRLTSDNRNSNFLRYGPHVDQH